MRISLPSRNMFRIRSRKNAPPCPFTIPDCRIFSRVDFLSSPYLSSNFGRGDAGREERNFIFSEQYSQSSPHDKATSIFPPGKTRNCSTDPDVGIRSSVTIRFRKSREKRAPQCRTMPVEESSQSISPDQAAVSIMRMDEIHPVSLILFAATFAVFGSISIPTYLRFRRFATIPTVPEPKKGSMTTSSFFDPALMQRSTSASGKTV